MSAFVFVVSQPGESISCAGTALSRGALSDVRCVCGGLSRKGQLAWSSNISRRLTDESQETFDSVVTDRQKCTRCQTCISACYSGARQFSGREVTVSEVMEQVKREIPFYDESGGGVTFSGGEPLMQPGFLSALLTRLS